MVEELKIIAEIVKASTDAAVPVLIGYMILGYLKPVTVIGIASVMFVKIAEKISSMDNK